MRCVRIYMHVNMYSRPVADFHAPDVPAMCRDWNQCSSQMELPYRSVLAPDLLTWTTTCQSISGKPTLESSCHSRDMTKCSTRTMFMLPRSWHSIAVLKSRDERPCRSLLNLPELSRSSPRSRGMTSRQRMLKGATPYRLNSRHCIKILAKESSDS